MILKIECKNRSENLLFFWRFHETDLRVVMLATNQKSKTKEVRMLPSLIHPLAGSRMTLLLAKILVEWRKWGEPSSGVEWSNVQLDIVWKTLLIVENHLCFHFEGVLSVISLGNDERHEEVIWQVLESNCRLDEFRMNKGGIWIFVIHNEGKRIGHQFFIRLYKFQVVQLHRPSPFGLPPKSRSNMWLLDEDCSGTSCQESNKKQLSERSHVFRETVVQW